MLTGRTAVDLLQLWLQEAQWVFTRRSKDNLQVDMFKVLGERQVLMLYSVISFYRSMLRIARYCYGKSSVCPSVRGVEVSWRHRLEFFSKIISTCTSTLAYKSDHVN